MTPEAQNIAIAEACGYISVPDAYYEDGRAWMRDGRREGSTPDLPNYTGDLNAMNEAVQRFRYTDTGSTLWASNQGYLMTIVARDLKLDRGCVSFMWEVQNATAAQRAEAFLRTLNLWKGGQP